MEIITRVGIELANEARHIKVRLAYNRHVSCYALASHYPYPSSTSHGIRLKTNSNLQSRSASMSWKLLENIWGIDRKSTWSIGRSDPDADVASGSSHIFVLPHFRAPWPHLKRHLRPTAWSEAFRRVGNHPLLHQLWQWRKPKSSRLLQCWDLRSGRVQPNQAINSLVYPLLDIYRLIAGRPRV
jgi:hypothetical protein